MPQVAFNNKLPNLKHLNYLLALNKYQHFNQAAQACFVSQSTLSSAIFKLEEQLSCQLLERDHKSFIFTSHGKQVIELARQLLVNANEFVSFAQRQGNVDSGTVHIGCIPTIAPFLLTDLVKNCQDELPKLELYLREDTTENLMAQLEQGQIDCVILALPVTKHHFTSVSLGKDDFYIAGDKSLVSNFVKSFDYQILPEKSVFLLNKEHCLTDHAISACQLADVSKINNFSASSIATLVQMTAFHRGVTFLPKMAIDKGIGLMEGLLIEPMQEHVSRDIGMLWRKNSMRDTTFSKLAELISNLL